MLLRSSSTDEAIQGGTPLLLVYSMHMISSGILLDKVRVSVTKKSSKVHLCVGAATLFAVALLAAGQVSWILSFSSRNFSKVSHSRAPPLLPRLLAKLFAKVFYSGEFR